MKSKIRNAYQKIAVGDTVFFAGHNVFKDGVVVEKPKGMKGLLKIKTKGKDTLSMLYAEDVVGIEYGDARTRRREALEAVKERKAYRDAQAVADSSGFEKGSKGYENVLSQEYTFLVQKYMD